MQLLGWLMMEGIMDQSGYAKLTDDWVWFFEQQRRAVERQALGIR